MPFSIGDVDKLLNLVERQDVKDLTNWFAAIKESDRIILANSKSLGGSTALCMACEFGNEGVVRLLMDNGASLNIKGRVEIVTQYGSKIVEQYPINAAINSANFNPDIFNYLIEKLKDGDGKIPTQLDSDGTSALYYATTILDKVHRYNCLKELLDSGIDYTAGNGPASIVLCSSTKEEYRNIQDIKLLLEKCTLYILFPLNGIGNCLYVAAAHGYKEAAEAIVAKARSMDDEVVARGRPAGVLQALVNNDKGECNDIAKLAQHYGYNDFGQWAKAAGLPAPEFYRGEIPESDAEESLVAEEAEEEIEYAAAGSSPAKRRKVDSEPEEGSKNNEEEDESPNALKSRANSRW